MTHPIILAGDTQRSYAKQCIDAAKPMSVVTVKDPTRNLLQNAKLWASLGDVAEQVKWHGLTLSPDDWKLIFMAGLNSEMRLVPNLDNNGFVNLGRQSSKLTVAEMADLITLIEAFGARHGVNWTEPKGE
jgi:hypothetical protein